jgi:hypothetical protein
MFEINLVPDVKRQLLHLQSMKRLVVFVCVLVLSIGAGILAILTSVVVWQQVTQDAKGKEIVASRMTFWSNPNINASLTIQNQLTQLDNVFASKKEVSRIFSVLDVILPTGNYKVSLSGMNINFQNNTIFLEGQARSATLNDAAALEAFEQTVIRTKYDYGRYYDKDGNVIPTIDITEISEGGSVYGVYRMKIDCVTTRDNEGEVAAPVEGETVEGDTPEERCQVKEVKIKRYSDDIAKDNGGYYFKSECGAYEVKRANGTKEVISDCELSKDGLMVTDRTSGRNSASNDVVLRFDGKLVIDPAVFAFNNKHMFIIGPSRQTVTDSYTQIRDMFEEEAKDCEPDDQACLNASKGGK